MQLRLAADGEERPIAQAQAQGGGREVRGWDRARRFAEHRLPYGLGAWLGPALMRRKRVREFVCPEALACFDSLRHLAQEPERWDEASSTFAATTGWRSLWDWRFEALARAGTSSLARWFPVKGMERLERARAGGRGVVLLNSHFGLGRMVPFVLARGGLPLVSIESVVVLEAEGLEVIPILDGFPARALHRVRAALAAGEIVHTTGDGYQGEGVVEAAFLGRRRLFARGVAGLAVRLDASVVPVFAPLRQGGRVHIEIGHPLDTSDPGAPPAEREQRLIRNYVQLLEERWRSDPGNIMLGHAERFLDLPQEAWRGDDRATGSAVRHSQEWGRDGG